jgi:dynein light chain 1
MTSMVYTLMCILHTGNPLEEKHSADGDWRDKVTVKLPKLKKLDGRIH